ncbi:tRNA (adenosine(37)-N6)-dimethylallyltransferase MiaA [Candidatus Viridilinea mediisalina]|uniref:tRNA dimethylallyltransferase n=1 Tax=Candidatus Viridilinea mediisalina TaxID=2024553 RepID=A0A2A6RDJ4_9CHLR|nr:tRNA (adenosine(37)-N6)-dimethylallyltransferase MiaA [Candidatus Viridilinea mediisalina]PDV99632.1 tRNA (adenosine(37)-N6)-dimethylallyltransferase MiaA [Candidatus Viridilinea mediisalina]
MPLLTAIVGPTAVGKTALAIKLAQQLGGEIVSADSRQIYRHMDIGTAKPTAEEQAAARHHLLDLRDPDEEFSLATFQTLATAALEDILARGRMPLLVGGTGQYLAAMLEGWQIPRVAPQPALRAALEQEAATLGVATLHARLAEHDPTAAAQIGPHNLRRIVRALEVYLITGEPISAQQTRRPPPYRIRTIWLTRPREELYARADARVDAMLAAGLVAEVANLVAQGYHWHLPAMSSLGYIQFRPYLEGTSSLAACRERLIFDTHRFIRRQIAWFRRLPHVEVWTP